jgi:signal transduction histidine kinase
MLNGVNPNYIVVLLVTGAVMLASIYHTILYVHRQSRLLLQYSIYLWSTFAYCLFRAIVFDAADPVIYRYFNPDEVLQMISFIMYIHFAVNAMDLDPKKDIHAILFAKITPYVISIYLIINTILVNVEGATSTTYVILKILARIYLLLPGFLMIVIVMRKKTSAFYGYLAAGAIAMIFFGLVSSLINLTSRSAFILGAISWLMFGFFTDVVFFSAAIGYRIRREHDERERSLQALIQKEVELQQKELEKLKAIYETREHERTRIAQDLHDEIGATLSGIALYSQLTKTQIKAQKNNEVEASLDRMHLSATEMVNKLSDIVWAVNPEKNSLEELWQKLDDYAREMAYAKGIEVESDLNAPVSEVSLSMEERRNIYLLLKEGINNAIKYSGCSLLQLNISKKENQLFFYLADNGRGFDAQQVRKGNGLLSINHRAKELNAHLMLESAPGKGTSLQLIFNIPQ